MKKLPDIFPAADGSNELKVWEKLKKIKNVSVEFGIKLNLDLVFGDLEIVRRIKSEFQVPLFVDLKMWNGKRTMAVIVEKLAKHGVDVINVYAHADTMLERVVGIANDNGVVVLGVTVLTHYTDEYCKRVYRRSIGESVRMLSEIALENGCHGIILPGTTLNKVSDFDCIKFVPALRPLWFGDKKVNFQEQIMTPGEARRRGATVVSCGSPIFKSHDPAQALQLISDEVKNV